MIDELNQAIETYHAKWHRLVARRKDKAFFQALAPTAVGWKAVDMVDFDRRLMELRDYCEHIHLAWLNERWLATLVFRDDRLACNLRIIKLMQRRPGSSDAIGLDHLDFMYSAAVDAKGVLEREPELTWSEENNGEQCKWLSLWFDGTEAKLRPSTVLQIEADELLGVQTAIIAPDAKAGGGREPA